MAKAQIPAITGKEINDSVVIGSSIDLVGTKVTWEEAFDIIENADNNLESLSSEYFRFDEFGTYVFFIDGFTEITIEDKTIEVVKMKDKKGMAHVNGDKLFVNACKRLKQLPSFVKVIYKGNVKTKQGQYKDLEVFTFPPAK